jgi:hypothetical protein
VYCLTASIIEQKKLGWPGGLLIGFPFAISLGMSAQVATLRAFPPKLEPHAEGSILLKLT